MAFQPETNTYPAGIYQLEVTDPVLGGLGGVDNSPLLQLACRTNYLKSIVDSLGIGVGGLAPINSPVFTGSPKAPTPAPSSNDTSIATTAYVTKAGFGVTPVTTTGGTTTLTADQASVYTISVTGTLTSNATVTVPAATGRSYHVINGTSGNFTLTVKVAAGAGLVVRQGTAQILYNDGTNLVDYVTAMAALTVTGNIALVGGATLENNVYVSAKLAAGTSTPVFGLSASDNLNIGSTGAAHADTVFYNNGTPLARLTAAGRFGVGINATSSVIHGYVAAANAEIRASSGATGDAILSAEAVGTRVAALAARRSSGYLALVLDGTDRLTLSTAGTMALNGIAHTEAFNVNGNAYLTRTGGATVRLVDQYAEVQVKSAPDSGLSASHLDLVTSGSTQARITSGGQLLVGTTTAGGAKLAVVATGSQTGVSTTTLANRAQFTGTDANVTYTAATFGSSSTAVAQYGTTSAHALALVVNGNEVARFDTNSNLGLGTTATNVAGYRSLAASGSTGGILDLMQGGTVRGRVSASGAGMVLDTMTAVPLILNANGSEAMRISSTGKVGINVTNPAAALNIGATGEALRLIGDATYVSGYDTAATTRVGFLQFSTTGNYVGLMAEGSTRDLQLGANGAWAMYIDGASGNIGVGTASPAYAVDVSGDVRATNFRGTHVGNVTGNLTGNVTGNVSGTAGSVAWTSVTGRPTSLSSFTNDPGYVTNADFTGNQSLVANGYCRLPGGMMMQWGTVSNVTAFQNTTITFPTPFSGTAFGVYGLPFSAGISGNAGSMDVVSIGTTSAVALFSGDANKGTVSLKWFAVGPG